MSKSNNIKKYTTIAILASLSSIISIIDKIIISCIIPYIPGIKIGLANVIVLYSIYNTNFKYSLLEVIIKIILVSFILGSISTFIIGGISSLISYFIMYLIYKYFNNKISIITNSVIGGLIHINMQLIIIKFIYKIGDEVYLYGIILIIISFFTSILVGLITNKINKTQFINKIMH